MLDQSDTEPYLERHKGERCFILGNGPSLTISDLDKLKGEVTFASNKIFLAFDSTTWRPTYYTAEDHLVIEQNLETIRAMKGFQKFFPDYAYRYFGRDNDLCYFRFKHVGRTRDAAATPNFPGFSQDASKCINWGSTVVYSQIQLAYHMGFREIYLLGVDHSYILPSIKQGNIYVSGGERNHFHQDYHLPGQKWHQPQLDVLERSYNYAAKVSKELDIMLRNASRSTQLDAIEKIEFEHLFK